MIDKQVSIRWKKFNKLIIYAGLVTILLLVPTFVKSVYLIHILNLTLIYIIAASSLRFINLSGQLSLGHAAFMSIGAYTAGVLSTQFSCTPWITIPLGALATMVVAIILGYIFTRLRALYFSMVSLFLGMGILAINSVFVKYTGGTASLTGISSLFEGSKLANYYFILGLTIFSLFVLWRLENCRIGTKFKSITQSYLLASSIGINESRYRAVCLAIGCLFVGLSGAIYAHYNLVLSQNSFNFLASVNILIYVLVGGIGSFTGPITGTALLIIIPEVFRGLKEYTPYLFVIILILVVFAMPEGLAGLPKQIRLWMKKVTVIKQGRSL